MADLGQGLRAVVPEAVAKLDDAGLAKDALAIVENSTLIGKAVEPAKVKIDPTNRAFIAIRHLPCRQECCCIRCGRCIDNCPAQIDPVVLHGLAKGKQWDKAKKYGVSWCFECGICSYVCPSRLPLQESILEIKRKLLIDKDTLTSLRIMATEQDQKGGK